MSMQSEMSRAAIHLLGAIRNNPSTLPVIVPILAAVGVVYGASKLYKYAEKKKEEKECEELYTSLSSGNR
ncbi:MAG TPA: hypothetical protein VN453_06715 [Feifaniaceae bacterium]|nr:hypothetical protein [Feifaniaceae bacterium]